MIDEIEIIPEFQKVFPVLTSEDRVKLQKIIEKASDKIKEDLLSGNISMSEAYRKITVHVGYNTGKYEWYTPKKFIDAARLTMGSIDLDPASSLIANEIIGATKIYTQEDNGINFSWRGNIWMNPPYNNSLVGVFTSKLVDELPNINQACVLVNNATETKWFLKVFEASTAICFVTSRIKFLDVNGKATGSSLQGQVIMYFGTNVDGFYNNFSSFGKCVRSSWKKDL